MKQRSLVFASVAVATIAFLFAFKGEVKAAISASFVQLALFGNNYFGFSLLNYGFSEDLPPMQIDTGYYNDLTMKFIYLSRYFKQDQFLFKSLETRTLKDIEARLNSQYKEKGWSKADLIMPVPTFEWGSIDAETFHNDYVKRGMPVIFKNFPNNATKYWTAEYFAEKYGDHKVEIINSTSIKPFRTTMGQFVQDAKKEQMYLRSLSDIFDVHEELTEEVGHRQFDDWMRGKYMTAQIFMGTKRPGTGTSYHCANFNNLFFQVLGRKKWTFVDPQYETLMYPMFNAKSMDVASFVTMIALADESIMQEHFPLYALAPKLVATLEPGDVLLNPPWNWHMVENLDNESIGVATRWFISKGHAYQNTLHSTLQWFSKYMWTTYYTKMLNLQHNIRAHTASNTPPMDERINFGKPGSAYHYIPKIFPDSFYSAYEEDLAKSA